VMANVKSSVKAELGIKGRGRRSGAASPPPRPAMGPRRPRRRQWCRANSEATRDPRVQHRRLHQRSPSPRQSRLGGALKHLRRLATSSSGNRASRPDRTEDRDASPKHPALALGEASPPTRPVPARLGLVACRTWTPSTSARSERGGSSDSSAVNTRTLTAPFTSPTLCNC
jgi:hypothetical protein